MRIQCCICSDLFDHEAQVSALLCGHTFHEKCLTQWLNTSKTCPHCRKKVKDKDVIAKLFFDKGELDEGEEEEDTDKIKNELNSVKALVSEKEREKEGLLRSQVDLQEKIVLLETNVKKVKQNFREEQTANTSLKKQLAYYELQQKEVELCKAETKKIRRKLNELVAVEQLVQGCDSDIQNIMQQYGTGENATRELATWCSVITKELKTKKQDNRSLRDEIEKLKKDLALKKQALREQESEQTSVREQLQHSENDLKHAEQQIQSLKKKMKKLQQALDSPSQTAASLAHRLLNESPAPSTFTPNLNSKPTLSTPNNDTAEIDLDTSMDLFATPEVPKRKKNSCLQENEIPKFTLDADDFGGKVDRSKQNSRQASEESGTQYIKIKTAASTSCQPAKKLKRDPQDISNMPAFANFNLFKSKSSADSVPSIVRNGYNGLGGHEKFVMPTGKPRFAAKKPSKNANIGKISINKKGNPKLPSLPTLDGFVCLD